MTATNTSFWAVPFAWAVAISPRAYSLNMYKKHSKLKPELKNPRSWTTQVAEDKTISAKMRGRILRAESAQANGLENLGYFAAAVAMGNAGNLDAPVLNSLAWGYIATRCLYNWVFIHNDIIPVWMRTAIFMVGIGINGTLFVLSGWSLQK